ncbi:hypothetical protein NUW58_g5559 [Xylaria curta]|uniref:Uncharacterized protein n=1 Tax=Xylaria curta TaxID=42375 RepID=A0ACC1P0Z6_9PEZI|nr:hypothetical protein NUW58_g5559 [Xylaria curta]
MTTQGEDIANIDEEQKSMLDACSSGDVGLLGQLFVKHGIRQGSKSVSVKSATASSFGTAPEEIAQPTLLPTHELLERAVVARQVDIVQFILSTYPSLSLNGVHEAFVRAVLKNPDAEVLRLLCNRDRTFANFSMDCGLRTFLTDACALPPPQAVPILHVLLDNGANVHDGWGPGGGALYAAIIGQQPREIVEKILSKMDNVSSRAIVPAIRQGDVDIVGALLEHDHCRSSFDVKECIKEAKKRGDKSIMQLVELWARSRPETEKKPSKKWWTFGLSRW